MADDTSASPLQLVEAEADGYCDPVNGSCAWPGATKVEADHTDEEPRTEKRR